MIKNLMYSLVQALTLIVWLHFLINCLNNRFFKPYCKGTQNWTFRISGAEFQRQGTLGAELVCFYIQDVLKCYEETTVRRPAAVTHTHKQLFTVATQGSYMK